MPLIVIAKSPSEDAAHEGLQRWKDKHPAVAALLAGRYRAHSGERVCALVCGAGTDGI